MGASRNGDKEESRYEKVARAVGNRSFLGARKWCKAKNEIAARVFSREENGARQESRIGGRIEGVAREFCRIGSLTHRGPARLSAFNHTSSHRNLFTNDAGNWDTPWRNVVTPISKNGGQCSNFEWDKQSSVHMLAHILLHIPKDILLI